MILRKCLGRNIDVLQGEAVAGHRADPDKPVAVRIDDKTQQGKEIAHLFALEKAAEMEHGDARASNAAAISFKRLFVRQSTAWSRN